MKNFREHPLVGSGAGTYRFVNLRLQSGIGMAHDPHSIWVRFLSLLASTVLTDNARGYLESGDLAGAEAAASRARLLNRYSTEPLIIESELAVSQADFNTARERLLDAIELEPEKSELYERLALLEFYDLKETDAGIVVLEGAIDYDPQFRGLHLMLHRMAADAETYGRTGQMPEAPGVAE